MPAPCHSFRVDRVEAAGRGGRRQPGPAVVSGGAWSDAFLSEDGRLVLLIGDAAAAGAELRSAARAVSTIGPAPRPADVLAGLDRFAAATAGAYLATAACAVLDPASGELAYSTAGHPPPLVRLPQGMLVELAGAASLPLGVRPGEPRPGGAVILPAGSTVVLYTEALLCSRAAEDAEAGALGRLAEVLADERCPPRLADALIEAAPAGDRAAVLCARYGAEWVGLRLRLDEPTQAVARARGLIWAWLASHGAAPAPAAEAAAALAAQLETLVRAAAPIALELELDCDDEGLVVRGCGRSDGGPPTHLERKLT